MTEIRAVTEADVPLVDQATLVACLRAWQEEGQANPLIPCDVDVDGDGTADAFGLSPLGQLVYVTGANLKHTVYEADGTGVEGDD